MVGTKRKAITVIGVEGPQVFERSRFTRFVDSQHIDGGDARLTRLPSAFYPQKNSWYSFPLGAESSPGS
jgi:hypothetical protein